MCNFLVFCTDEVKLYLVLTDGLPLKMCCTSVSREVNCTVFSCCLGNLQLILYTQFEAMMCACNKQQSCVQLFLKRTSVVTKAPLTHRNQ